MILGVCREIIVGRCRVWAVDGTHSPPRAVWCRYASRTPTTAYNASTKALENTYCSVIDMATENLASPARRRLTFFLIIYHHYLDLLVACQPAALCSKENLRSLYPSCKVQTDHRRARTSAWQALARRHLTTGESAGKRKQITAPAELSGRPRHGFPNW